MHGEKTLNANAVILSGPKSLSVEAVELVAPGDEDIVVDVTHSGISTGTEKLFWDGRMPPFPGMGYPLIPGWRMLQASLRRRGQWAQRGGPLQL